MPEFIMPLGDTHATHRAFDALPEFTRGYIEALFFTNATDPEDELYEKTFEDLAPETLAAIQSDCDRFAKALERELDLATELNEYEPVQAGRDLWFTRCGHGVGFDDRELGHIGLILATVARRMGERSPYVGDDGLIYMST